MIPLLLMALACTDPFACPRLACWTPAPGASAALAVLPVPELAPRVEVDWEIERVIGKPRDCLFLVVRRDGRELATADVTDVFARSVGTGHSGARAFDLTVEATSAGGALVTLTSGSQREVWTLTPPPKPRARLGR